jgi:hypothetical protein
MFTLDQVVPWGRSFEEYRAMFALTDRDLKSRLLGCGDGPAGFNAVATSLGAAVISCDPIYQWGVPELRGRITDTYAQVLEQTRQNEQEFIWDTIPSIEALGRTRMAAMDAFLTDYPAGQAAGRYVAAELPTLPFEAQAFDLALCSHLLFLYSSQLGEPFHHASLIELCRVAGEVRVFPLLALGGSRSPYVDGSIALLRSRGLSVSIEAVPYEFQRGGNEMLRCRQP